MDKLEELKQEAKELGIKFGPKIGEVALQEKIDAHDKAEAQKAADSIQEQVTAKEAEELASIEANAEKSKRSVVKRKTMLQKSKEAEARARKTKVVEIIDNDPRVNSHVQTVTVTCGNEYFELGSKRFLLGKPVEVEQGYINVLKETTYEHYIKGAGGKPGMYETRRRYSISEVQV